MNEVRYTHIGGWLAFFVFVCGLGGILNFFRSGSLLNDLVLSKSWSVMMTYLMLDAVAIMGYGAFQLIVAYRLFKLKPTAACQAKRVLLFGVIACTLSLTACFFLVFTKTIPSNGALSNFIIGRIMTVFTASVWFLYFKFSKRVKQTFGEQAILTRGV